jgi:hypothetical protein
MGGVKPLPLDIQEVLLFQENIIAEGISRAPPACGFLALVFV